MSKIRFCVRNCSVIRVFFLFTNDGSSGDIEELFIARFTLCYVEGINMCDVVGCPVDRSVLLPT